MKMKTFSKIVAVALTAMMTLSLTACEDERSIPVQGSGLQSESGVHHQIVTKPESELPTEAAQGADFMLINAVIEQGTDGTEYLILYTGVTNLTNEPHTADELLGVSAWYPDNTDSWFSGAGLWSADIDVGDFIVGNSAQPINPGEQSLVTYAYGLAPDDIAYVTIQAYDITLDEVIFETNIELMTE